MSRSVTRAAALAVLVVLVAAAGALGATRRTSETPEQLRAGHAAYLKAVASRWKTATRLLDAQLRRHPRNPAVVLDIDETALSNWACLDEANFDLTGLAVCVLQSRSVALPGARAFFRHAQRRNVEVDFITGAQTTLCDGRRANLAAQGFDQPFRLTCRPPSDDRPSVIPYKSGARRALTRRRNRTIVLDVGDQASDLAGGYARKTLKLPNPIYVID